MPDHTIMHETNTCNRTLFKHADVTLHITMPSKTVAAHKTLKGLPGLNMPPHIACIVWLQLAYSKNMLQAPSTRLAVQHLLGMPHMPTSKFCMLLIIQLLQKQMIIENTGVYLNNPTSLKRCTMTMMLLWNLSIYVTTMLILPHVTWHTHQCDAAITASA